MNEPRRSKPLEPDPFDSLPSPELDAFKARSDSAWEGFFSRYAGHGGRIERWCARAGIKRDDLPDAVQQVSMRVLRKINSFQPNGRPGCFAAWLAKVTLSTALNFYRVLGHRHAPLIGDPEDTRHGHIASEEADDGRHPRDSDAFEALFEQVRREVGEENWLIFYRVVVDGCSEAELAKELNTTAGAVRMRKRRVLKRLRDLAAGLGLGEPRAGAVSMLATK